MSSLQSVGRDDAIVIPLQSLSEGERDCSGDYLQPKHMTKIKKLMYATQAIKSMKVKLHLSKGSLAFITRVDQVGISGFC